ncbi:MAG TPA: hypothetical protein HPQ03_09345 [Deltaproteobacteria bacterium]|nr:hypothetical protein [Deltaproteobacteria bacterium]
MFPVRSLSDLLANIDTVKQHRNISFYTMVLYKGHHTEMREYVQENFDKIHRYTDDVLFAVIDAPSGDWADRQENDFYRKTMGEGYQTQLNDYEIDIICEYLKLYADGLPYVIFFSDPRRGDCNMFSFRRADQELIERFFGELLDHTAKLLYGNFDYLNLMSEIRNRFPEIPHKIIKTYPERTSIVNTFEDIQSVIGGLANNKRKKESVKPAPDPTKKTRTSTKIKYQVQALGIKIAKEDKGKSIRSTGELAKHSEIEEIAGVYSVMQRQRWLSEEISKPEYQHLEYLQNLRKPGIRSQKKKNLPA